MKKSARVKIILRLAALFFAICLAGCAAATTPTPTPEPITITYAYLGEKSAYEALVEQFQEQYPYVTIELDALSIQEQRGNFNQLIERFQQADVVRANNVFLGPEQLDALYSLDDFIAVGENFSREDFFSGSLEAFQHEQRQYGIPAGIDPVVMFYENMRFKAAKVTPPGVNYTLDDFLQSAMEVNNQEADRYSGQFAYGFCTNPLAGDPVIIASMFGGSLFDSLPDITRPTLNSPAIVEAITWYASLWTDYKIVPEVSDNPYESYQNISSSYCAYWINYFDMFGYMRSATMEGRVLPLPRVVGAPEGANSYFAIQDGYYITKSSTHPQMAWNWITFIVQHLDASLTQIPPLKSLIASEEYALRAAPDVLALARSLPDDMFFLNLDYLSEPKLNEVSNIFQRAVMKIVEEKADVQTTLDEAQKEAEEVMASSEE